MAAGRALEWVRMFEAQVEFFSYDISGLYSAHMALCEPNWSKMLFTFQQVELWLVTPVDKYVDSTHQK